MGNSSSDNSTPKAPPAKGKPEQPQQLHIDNSTIAGGAAGGAARRKGSDSEGSGSDWDEKPIQHEADVDSLKATFSRGDSLESVSSLSRNGGEGSTDPNALSRLFSTLTKLCLQFAEL